MSLVLSLDAEGNLNAQVGPTVIPAILLVDTVDPPRKLNGAATLASGFQLVAGVGLLDECYGGFAQVKYFIDGAWNESQVIHLVRPAT